ncbi:MAG TPA: glycosyltransferase family 2 protein, partial [Candidatus Omnitrophota bacterium]|nr:glycosyltransferase family 2 protein [Candidatus Omnitrophota bacterium]
CNNEATLKELYDRAVLFFCSLKLDHEIIFVDDGSKDGSLGLITGFYDQDPRVKIVKLKKNAGQSLAILAGLGISSGEVIVAIDADLQYAPEDISILLNKINSGFDVVGGWRKQRSDPFLSRIFPSVFANFMARCRLGREFKDIGCFFIAFKKDMAVQVKKYGSQSRFLKPLFIKIGSFTEVEVNHYARKNGSSQFSFTRLIKIALDFMLNFSPVPGGRGAELFVVERIYSRSV